MSRLYVGTSNVVDGGELWRRPCDNPGDFDVDCDVDKGDFDIFSGCATGPTVPQGDPGCSLTDLDGDGDVDQSDFSILQRCISGQNIPGDPRCAD
jgi:hypothetical protein